MDRFVQEQIRVQTALLEFERQRVKLLISSGNAIALKQYALSARADLEIIRSDSAHFRVKRAKRNAPTQT